MVGDLVAILNDRGISKTGFFGYSMGGRVGFRIPLYAPDRFSALILGGATYPIHGDEDANDEVLAQLYQALDLALKGSPNDAMAAYLARLEAMNPPFKLLTPLKKIRHFVKRCVFYLNSHSQYGSPIAIHLGSLTQKEIMKRIPILFSLFV
jgi:pimeloyl-ACP methyl ester carboxylesterase